MNNKLLFELLSESAKLEENVGALYLKISTLFPEDRDFWVQLAEEEKHHASIFRTFFDKKLPLFLFPEEMMDTDLARLKENNKTIKEVTSHLLSRFKNKMNAYAYALELEESAGEMHFQQAMSAETDSESLLLLQGINKDDKDHYKRIKELIETSKQNATKIRPAK